MKAGETVISPKNKQSEILVLRGDGNLYGNHTSYNYGEAEAEEKKEETSEENKDQEKEEGEKKDA